MEWSNWYCVLLQERAIEQIMEGFAPLSWRQLFKDNKRLYDFDL